MQAILHLGALLIVLAPVAAEPAGQEEATTRAVRQMLEECWSVPAGKLKKFGAAAVHRARSQHADLSLVSYAYGLTLANAGFWDAAETTFKRVAQDRSDFAPAWILLAIAQVQQRKFDAAFASLLKGVAADPAAPQAADVAGALIAFLREHPPERLRRNVLKDAEDQVLAAFDSVQKARYGRAAADVRRYLAALPQLREERLEEPRSLRKEAEARRKQIAQLEKERQWQEYDRERLAVRAQTIVTGVLRVQTAANEAAKNENASPEEKSFLNNLAIANALHANSSLVEVQSAQRLLENLIRQNEQERSQLARAVRELESKASEAERRIDEELKRPPLPVTPATERERLLAALPKPVPGDAAAEPAKDEPAAPVAKKARPEDERKAKSLLGLADTLAGAGKPDKAAEYYQRIVKLFPETQAAKIAAEKLNDPPSALDELP